MANVTLVFKKTTTMIDSIELDASVSESHQSEVEITEHPVEQGTNIVDHARPKPDVITIEGLITNTPMPNPSDPLITRTSTSASGQVVTFDSRGGGNAPTRAGQAYKDLLALKDASKLITVVTGLRTYENMMLRSLSIPRDVKTSQSLRFSATMVEVKVVTSQKVEVVAQKKTSLGKKSAPDTAAPQKAKTTLLQIKNKAVEGVDYIKGLLGK